MKRIVVVGGGAGGLELVAKLGRKLGKKKKAHITLIDRSATHLWKPLLHEIAVGAMDVGTDAVSYRAHAQANGFYFRIGSLIDRVAKQVVLAPLLDQDGIEVLPTTRIDYDILVLALGSTSNDFGTVGVKDHCIFLDSAVQAQRFRDKLFNHFLRIQRLPNASKQVRVAIVGGGATGVELSAELHHAVEEIHHYGFDELTNEQLKITLVEAGPRILGALPERISSAATGALERLGVEVRTNTLVTEAKPNLLCTKSGDDITADLIVWAAGIKVSDYMKELSGLKTNRINQFVVNQYLLTSNDDSIYAIGDCAAFTMGDGKLVPPRAQSAHQMADCCYKNIVASMNNEPLNAFNYKDHGSLISLSQYSTVGSLISGFRKDGVFVEGRLARFMYISLYRMHQIAVHGWLKSPLLMVASRLNRWLRPKIKLH